MIEIDNHITEAFIAGVYTGIMTTVSVIFLTKYLKAKKEKN